MANGANKLTAVDLLIEAAKVDRATAISVCGELLGCTLARMVLIAQF